MISFLCSIGLLILGYIFYGKFVEKLYAPNENKTIAYIKKDGVDYVPMPVWKTYLIQLLNIAGTGPIFGALAGAVFGPVVYLWIVFGCIFGGAVHDYFCGMLSERNNGASVSEIVGKYLGNGMKNVMRVFSVILLLMCGVVFTEGPAELIAMLTPETLDVDFWLTIVMVYYFVATFVPIDKIIGRIYPIFGLCLILMAIGVGGTMLISKEFVMPEIWDHFRSEHPTLPCWPYMLITVACGAISGFHATQSPLMARCLNNKKDGRKVFYGAMISEGMIALVWAAAGVTLYETREALQASGMASIAVYDICMRLMGPIGGIVAVLGVIVCPISSGDTAYRSARLTIADWFKIDQSKWQNRFVITLLLLITGAYILDVDYGIIWRYFSFSNQSLATIVLWAESIYLLTKKKNYFITLIPAIFMTAVTSTYFMVAPECLEIPYKVGVIIGISFTICLACLFFKYKERIAKGVVKPPKDNVRE
ncbi:MAG: carbon starvation protein A [Lachnospiraceae bacterium]|nr:carbon starvation protein A [Lachnospiraceae bacterium]